MGPKLIENTRNKTSEIFASQLPALQANTDEGNLLLCRSKCMFIYLGFAEAFRSVFTDNPVGGKNLAPDTLSAQWIRLQPITSQYTLCQSEKLFPGEQLLIELWKTWDPICWDVGEKNGQDQTLLGTRNSFLRISF